MNNIFKTYDVRGVYPSEINEELAFKIGKAVVKETKAKKIAVGRDARNSSLKLSEALIKGITSEGCDVVDIGEVPTDCVYFSLVHYKYDASIMTTASHNPPEYNGFKMMKNENDFPTPLDVSSLKKRISEESSSERKGKIEKKDIWNDYINHLSSFVDFNKIKPFKVVIDASNGTAGKVIERLNLPVEVTPLNFKPDGNFPSHSPNPLEEGSTDQISKEIKKVNADFGFIFDGDGDRIFLIDEKGEMVPADIVLLFLAEMFLTKNPGETIVYNLLCSHSVPEFIEKWQGKAVKSPVGYINIWKNMKKNKAVLGGEISAHYAFRKNFYSDSAFLALLTLLEIFSKGNKKISEKVKQFNIYYKISETNFKVENKDEMIEKLKNKFSDGKQEFLDGLTVEYKDWWFNIRKSNTEPFLRLNMEAESEELLKEKKEEIVSFIKNQ